MKDKEASHKELKPKNALPISFFNCKRQLLASCHFSADKDLRQKNTKDKFLFITTFPFKIALPQISEGIFSSILHIFYLQPTDVTSHRISSCMRSGN